MNQSLLDMRKGKPEKQEPDHQNDGREVLTTESKVREKIKQEVRAKDKERYNERRKGWNERKAAIDAMTPEELKKFIKDNKKDRYSSDTNATTRISAHDYAAIRLACKVTGKTIREILVDAALSKCKG